MTVFQKRWKKETGGERCPGSETRVSYTTHSTITGTWVSHARPLWRTSAGLDQAARPSPECSPRAPVLPGRLGGSRSSEKKDPGARGGSSTMRAKLPTVKRAATKPIGIRIRGADQPPPAGNVKTPIYLCAVVRPPTRVDAHREGGAPRLLRARNTSWKKHRPKEPQPAPLSQYVIVVRGARPRFK